MKNSDEIRWLQLSDLHMFDSTEMKVQKKALFQQFTNKIDFIVITGDLHQYGKDYSLTLDFLNELYSQMKIEKKDIFIVPGNHDVANSEKRKKILDEIDKKIENNPDVYRSGLKGLYAGFKKYRDFLQAFYDDNIEDYSFLENNIRVWENKIGIVCINTALGSDENHFKPQFIDIYGLEELQNKNLPCIAIMHHDYYAITDAHKPYLNNRLHELGVSATLSGHKHRYSKGVIELQNGEIISNYCCAKSISQPDDLWSDVGIIEYRWNLKENNVRVIPYEWGLMNGAFIPSMRFESSKNLVVNNTGSVTFTQSFKIKNNVEKNMANSSVDNMEVQKIMNEKNEFEEFYNDVQKKYLDKILDYIQNDDKKYNRAINMMERIVTYEEKKLEFYQIIDLILSCRKKVVLSINGLQGTGKSTFLSLVYFELKKRYEKTKVFPILIDLHSLDNNSKTKAKNILQDDLDKIDKLIRKNQSIRFLLLFDGADDYRRKTTDLEDILCKYVERNQKGNFAFCIGSADNLPEEMCERSKLQKFSYKASYKMETHRMLKEDDDKITAILKALFEIYSFNVREEEINVIKRAINVYTISKIDYRTLLIVLRVIDMNTDHKIGIQLGNYFYDYYITEMGGSEGELYKLAKCAYCFTILRKSDAFRSIKRSDIIYNNGITIDFLLAYYFVYIVKNNDVDLKEVLNSKFVFTASVNKFIKDLILNKYKNEQQSMVQALIKAYDISDMPMKSQICYILGRIEAKNARETSKNFLIKQWDSWHDSLFREGDKCKEQDILKSKEQDILRSKEQDIKSELVLFRTISVSLIWIGYDKKQEEFLNCLLLNEKLNQINRGFHLEYYEEKAYMNGESPTYVDDKNMPVDNTMKYLINNINKGFSATEDFNKSIYLDIITLYSIYQYRMENSSIREKYEATLAEIAEKILKSPKIQSTVIINYVTTIKELLVVNPYKTFLRELYKVKTVRREGWIRRNIQLPESIAEHMYGCYLLGIFFLPNNIHQCIDYNIPDIKKYVQYSKKRILEMLLLHDLAEVKIGDIVSPEKVYADEESENKRFDYYEYLCSFPGVYGLGNQKGVWEEFAENSTINAKIANDLDKIEAVIQAYMYQDTNEINMEEWKEYARKNVYTSLGKQFLEFVIDKIIV